MKDWLGRGKVAVGRIVRVQEGECFKWVRVLVSDVQRIRELEADNARLREYARHKATCRMNSHYGAIKRGPLRCTCGLDAPPGLKPTGQDRKAAQPEGQEPDAEGDAPTLNRPRKDRNDQG